MKLVNDRIWVVWVSCNDELALPSMQIDHIWSFDGVAMSSGRVVMLPDGPN